MTAPQSVRRSYVVRLLERGIPRIRDGQAGMTFLVDKFTAGSAGPVAHVRDYRFSQPYDIWSLAFDQYEFVPENQLADPY